MKRIPAAAPAASQSTAAAPIAVTDVASASATDAASDEPSTAGKNDSSAETGDLIEVRVLSAFGDFQPNDVVELSETEIRALGPAVDADPAAVEYVKSLQA